MTNPSPQTLLPSPALPALAAPLTPLMPVIVRPPAVMSRGQGSYLWDESGTCYLDMVQGWAANALGHSAPELLSALAEQSCLLINPSPAYYNRPAIELARLLTSLTGSTQVAFLNSGAEAIETAIKLARKWGQRHKRGAYTLLTAQDSFHGRTLAAMAASGKPGWEALFPPYPPGFRKVPFGDLSAVARSIDPSCVALMVEPIQGEAGAVVPPEGYLRGLRELCDRHELLLILDEVQTGLGRTGTFLAQEQAGLRADITLLGKGLGAGLPISAVLCGERAACFELGDNGSTHGGNPLLAHVGLEVTRLVSTPAFLEQVRQRSAQLETVLEQLARRWGGATRRGRGLLQALVLDEPVAVQLVESARSQGLLINAARPNVLRFMPQLRISASEIDEFASRLSAARASLLRS